MEEEALRKAANNMARFTIGNAGFGPLAAHLLNLEALFDFTPGLVRNAEIEAGLFELVRGVLKGSHEEGMLVAVVHWTVLMMFMIEVMQQREAARHGSWTGHCVETFINDMNCPKQPRPGRTFETMKELPGWGWISPMGTLLDRFCHEH